MKERYGSQLKPALALENVADAFIKDIDVGSGLKRKKALSPKQFEENLYHRKDSRSPELKLYIEKNFKDQQALTERKKQANSLMLTTPFINGGFIDKTKLTSNPNNIFEVLGLEKGL